MPGSTLKISIRYHNYERASPETVLGEGKDQVLLALPRAESNVFHAMVSSYSSVTDAEEKRRNLNPRSERKKSQLREEWRRAESGASCQHEVGLGPRGQWPGDSRKWRRRSEERVTRPATLIHKSVRFEDTFPRLHVLEHLADNTRLFVSVPFFPMLWDQGNEWGFSNYGTEWHVAQATISSHYKAFSREKIYADVAVKIGLNSVNITLQATSIHKRSEDINYNERFRWVGATEMKQEYRDALVKGLPFPLLTIAEYFTQELEGFCWGRRYRLAGYYSYILLW
ncbi:dual oxidase maturation factor 1 [Caerostris darwini]|uniref:Dual oxidase maturation factor 1 n=1 Tax=Caerostris darwini TaxID=1538125 RepID=A0AAV4W045_9ARAC|nr:dual oxidase maturation factor 1 [Caerostris darwini]